MEVAALWLLTWYVETGARGALETKNSRSPPDYCIVFGTQVVADASALCRIWRSLASMGFTFCVWRLVGAGVGVFVGVCMCVLSPRH